MPLPRGSRREELDPSTHDMPFDYRCGRLWKQSNDERREQRDPQGQLRGRRAGQDPRGAEPPFTVFINGVEQSEDVDYRDRGRRGRLHHARS